MPDTEDPKDAARRWLDRLDFHPGEALDHDVQARVNTLADRLAAAGDVKLASELRRALSV